MKRFAFRALAALAFAVVLLATAGLFLQSRIQSLVVKEINKYVTVPVKVKEINFSLIKHFPYASVTFVQVEVDDRLREKQKLLTVQRVSLMFHVWSLWGEQLKFKKIEVRDGALNLFTNAQGANNYDIFKKSDAKNGSFSASLQTASLHNIHLTSDIIPQKLQLSCLVNELKLTGDFSVNRIDVKTSVNLIPHYVSLGGERKTIEKNLSGKCKLVAVWPEQRYTLHNGEVSIAGNLFQFSGNLVNRTKQTDLQFNASCMGDDIGSLLGLLPDKLRSAFATVDGSGKYNIRTTVQGALSQNTQPHIRSEFALMNGEVKLSAFGKQLKNTTIQAVYHSDINGSDTLNIRQFSFTIENSPFSFRLMLCNLRNPTFDFKAEGELPLHEFNALIPDTIVQELDGRITFKNFHLRGKKSDFDDLDNSTLSGSGEAILHEVEGRFQDITYGNINGLLRYKEHSLDATCFTLNFLSTDFTFTGTIHHLLPYVYQLSTKRNAGGITLGVDGVIKTNFLNLTGMLEAYDKKNRRRTSDKGKINLREVFNMRGNLLLHAGKLLLRKMEFENVYADLQLGNGVVRINGLQAVAMKGNLNAKGMVAFTENDELVINADVSTRRIDLPTLFQQCENFGQQTLTDRHLQGNADVTASFTATWKKYQHIDPSSIRAVAEFTIRNGELIQFEPLYAASRFIKIEELQRIRFAELTNALRIQDEEILIPEFEIRSSALNLMLYGRHRFDNNVDYHFKINLHKYLAQRFRSKLRNNIEYMETDPYEGLNIHLSMIGPLDNPSFKFDKAATRKKIADDLRREKQELQRLIKSIPEPTHAAEKIREEKHFEIQEQPQFIEWDEPK
ncbi:MAG: AsmA-like C-terminal region-containing protein [Chitinophagales bacterium]|nr:AsmA-like C-terminal region-containing protein [Chitinophagales bacterium]MDW8419489.1 AsmA-like C-terminal region-containing protein [Chitinophagales bacterium]